MIIRSRTDQPIIIGGFILALLGLEILSEELLTGHTPINAFWIGVLTVVIYGTYFTLVDLYVGFFKSPRSIELKDDTLVIKMVFRKPISMNVRDAERAEKKRFFQIWGFYNVRLMCPSRNLALYFLKDRFEHLDEFLRELKKANPSCQIDESLMQ